MKRFCSLFIALLCLQASMAQTKLSHSSSESMTGGSVSCSVGSSAYHTDNYYFRHFVLSDFGIVSSAKILYMEVSIRVARSLAGAQTIHSTVYELNGDFERANFGFISTRSITVNDTNNARFQVGLNGTIEPGDTIIAELYLPSGSSADSNYVGVAFNSAGETDPTYLSAPACGMIEPTDIDTVGSGFPNSHLVLSLLVNQVPEMQGALFSGILNTTFSFSEPHIRLTFLDGDGDKPEMLKILTLPSHGTLTLASSAVAVGDSIARADYGDLDYIPDGGFVGLDSFEVSARDDHHYAANGSFIKMNIANSSGLEEREAYALKVFPNPAQDEIVLEFPQDLIGETINLSDATGKTLALISVQNVMETLKIATLAPGLYLLHFQSEEKIYSGQFSKL